MTLVACGSSTTQPEVRPAPPLTAQSVTVRQTGNASAQVVDSTITYQLDASGSLVIHLSVQSQSASAQTITARASLYDAKNNLIGDATGGQISVAPGSTAPLQLNGPAPTGTIAGTVFEVSNVASPTPTSTTPIPTAAP
ncbi:MAG: hypothetical protein JOZ75_06835 [Candidatus Dormibacteraeota bacterium]|nr:hypothetical protein [Candidatus Dormibacteraeota bacterium]